MSDLKIDGQTSVERAIPLSISEAIKQLKDCSIVICPDTNVLWHMIRIEKNKIPILQLNAWLEQMEHCSALLDNQKVGWLIPKQIIRELASLLNAQSKKKDNFIKRLQRSNDFLNELNTDEINDNSVLYNINCSVATLCNKLKSDIKNNCDSIGNKSIILKEDKSLIYKAWELVYGEKFPNINGQQMKDTTILYHLHAFCGQLKKEQNIHSVYFWTFDNLGQHNIERFPHNQQENYINISRDIRKITVKSESSSLESLLDSSQV